MSEIMNFSIIFQKQVMQYVTNSGFSRQGESYLTTKIYCKYNYCSYDFTVFNLVLSNEKGNWQLKRTINHYYDCTWFIY